jgi:uncharacterized RDD family membrane protein YckC
MVDAALPHDAGAPQPAYARFSRRLRAVFIDWLIFVLILLGALIIMVAVKSDTFSRGSVIVLAAVLLFYEPLLVWKTGSSIGHYLTNLRVVDDRTGGNVSFPKAFARLLIKTILGWYSFITMATTRRHQALHDLLTRSTVQIRDPIKADPDDFVRERISGSGMPSPARRVGFILAYLLLLSVVLVIVVNGLALGGTLSQACVIEKLCTPGENLMYTIVGLVWFGLCALVMVLGWRGYMPGCRAKRVR